MASNLVPGGSAGPRFSFDENQIRRMKQAVQFIPRNGRDNTLASARGSILGIKNRAQAIFESHPRRPGESGEGTERGRQTGKFIFGGKDEAGTAFHGGTFKVSDTKFGFGYPDAAQADRATNYVWRSLEYGLVRSTSFFGDGTYFPQSKEHHLPNKFYFTSPNSATSALRVYRKGQDTKGQRILKGGKGEGKGFEGKHFIEGAWESSIQRIGENYKRALTKTAAEFGRRS